MNSVDYKEQMLGELNNELHNNPLQSDPTSKHISVVEKWCLKWLQKGKNSPKIANWVNNTKAKPGVAFGNVKMHKDGKHFIKLFLTFLALLITYCSFSIYRLHIIHIFDLIMMLS